MRHLTRLFAAFATLFVLAGCSTSPRLGGFGVSLAGIRAVEPGLLESKVTATIRIINENIHPLGISGSKHTLSINGERVGRAVSATAVGIPQLSTETLDVTFIVDNLSLANRLKALTAGGSITYVLDSTLVVRAGEDSFSYDVRGTGTLDLSGLQGAP